MPSGELLGSEPIEALTEAERSRPEAVAERAASRTRYVGLNRAEAVSLAEKVFHIEKASWTAPGADEGGRISKYLSETAAVEDTPSGKHLLVESTVPLQSAVGSGQLTPTSLALQDRGEAFVPANPVVPISISKAPAPGVTLPWGVSVAPKQAETPEASVAVGDQVVYPGTATDTDFMVQPVPEGIEASWQLRSEHSPQNNALVFSLPQGASLQWSKSTAGAVEVVKEGQALTTVSPAIAIEADGTALPVSYAVSGNVLTTHVDLSGSVAFPVIVDPIITGSYGSSGSGTWTGWHHSDNCSCTSTKEESGLLRIGMNPGPANGAYGEWYIWAPGAGKEGAASIERVDVSGISHEAGGQSYFEGWIYKSSGSHPVWTFNGYGGAQGEGTLVDGNALSNTPAAFCAQGAGGHDGGEQPLCNENYGGEAFSFADELGPNARTTYNYAQITGASVKFLDTTPPNEVKLENVYEKWSKHGPTGEYIHGEDKGVGVDALSMEIPPGHLNEHGQPFYADTEYSGCAASNGFDGCYAWINSPYLNYEELATGAYTLGVYAYDATGNVREETPDPKLYIDHTPPKLSLSGTLAEAKNGTIGEGSYSLSFTAEDGSSSAPQSGPHTVNVYVDGHKVDEAHTGCPEPTGVPSSWCYTMTEWPWTFEAQKYGLGSHTITVTAKDWAGNETTESFNVTVDTASYQPLGPGAVNLNTGDYKLSATDVAIAGANASLTVARTFDSRNLTQGTSGPLGSQWALSLPDESAGGVWQSLHPTPNGSIVATTAAGTTVTFTSDGKGGYVSPPGYQTYTLTEPSKSPVEYKITNAGGNGTIFTFAGTISEPRGEEESEEVSLYEPTGVVQAGGAGGINKVTYSFTKTSEGIVEPTEVLAPEPTAGSCAPILVKGCRALTFNYASSTTATGETESQWGDYKGRLTRVYFTAWNPSKGEMTTTTVAQYAYDTQGRLRAEWDPRVSPALKTAYGYDKEGHVTALTFPGQQSWALTYGTASGDASTGRLLAATQAPASASLWNGEPLSNTEAPKITGSPIVGNKMSVSIGKWSAMPVGYTYQWEDCNSEGKECTPVLGATNATYKPTESDDGHALSVVVSAINGSGAATVTAAESVRVGITPEPVYSTSVGSEGTGPGQLKLPAGVAADSKGNIWVSDTANNRIEKFNEKGEYVASYGSTGSGNGQFKTPEGIAISSSNNVWIVDRGNHRIQELNEKGEYQRQYTGGSKWYEKLEEPTGIALQGGGVWVADGYDGRLVVVNETGTFNTYWDMVGDGGAELKSPHGLAFTKTASSPWVADTGNNRIMAFGGEGEYSHQLEIEDTTGGFNGPQGIAADSKGNIWIADTNNNRVEEVEPFPWYTWLQTRYITQFGTYGSGSGQLNGPGGITVDGKGNIWVADTHNNRLEKWVPSTAATVEGESVPTPAPRWTVEYKVPYWGSSAPLQMTETETKQWGQKDNPTTATAIFPPDETQEWPASDYKRANLYYLDTTERTVNTAGPTGGISTTEYDLHNNVTRTLTADNRALALKEGSKSAEASKQLDTESAYNSEGTQLESTLGPEHKVKLTSGSEVQARKLAKYSYEEGAPTEGGPYRLMTKTTEAAKLSSGEEKDTRTVTDSYSGQEGLGWKLRKPTSITTAPGGPNLTRRTVYSSTTGAPTETTTPAGTTPQIAEYALPSGSHPFGITTGPDKNLWFTDTSTGKAGKITTGGSVTEYAAEKDEPEGITSGPDGNLWFVEHSIRHVNHMTTSGGLTVYTLTRTSTYNVGITAGPDENLWFTESTSGYIAKINTKDEMLGEYVLPSGSKPNGITVGPDKNLWFTDYGTNKIGKITTSGTITEYALPSGSEPYGIASGPDGNLWFTDYGTNKIGKITTSGTVTEYSLPAGSQPRGITSGPDGNLWFTDYGTNKVGKITTSGTIVEYSLPTGSEPQEITKGPDNKLWFTDYGTNKIGALNPSAGEAHTSQTIYYTPGTEASVATCQNHPEWANLPCQIQPEHQPETAGLPELPDTTVTYNIWDEPEFTKSTSGSATRTETDTYDSAGRQLTRETTSSTGTSLPKVTNEYSTETGVPTKQRTTVEGKEQSIASVYNKLGQLTSYTDADGNTATYKYDIDGRIEETSDGKGSQTFSYDKTTGALTKLTDSAAGSFTASYDAEGRMLSEVLPNGMTASYTYNPEGEKTGVEYIKMTHCSSGCTWFSDSATPSIHGQWLTQTSTLSSENYTFDEVGRLTQVQDTPAGKGCGTRIYAYDEDGNRTSLTTRSPGTEGKCATEGGTTQTHAYDAADRLIDPGVAYNAFGDITTLPAGDASDSEPGSELTSTYYTDGQVASQTQEGLSIGYYLDPARRTRETVSTGKRTSDVISHYDSTGSSPAWTSYTSGEWTRNIFGINGVLVAEQYNSESPVLQIVNLHGDIVGTASLSETATKPLSTEDMTEYGVPTTSTPPKYSWLGSGEFPTEFSSGIVSMGARSYVPEIGRFLQPDPQPGGSANAYAYTYGNPLNEIDPSGQWTLNETSGGASAVGSGEGVQLAGGVGIAAGAIMPAPVNTQLEEAFWSSPPWDQATAGIEEYEEYEEEESEAGYEETAYHAGAEAGKQGAYTEPAVLYQSLPTEESETDAKMGELARQCRGTSSSTSRVESCERYASLLGKALGVIKKGWKAVKAAARAAWKYVGDQTVSWGEFKARVKSVFGTGKEIFSLAKCTYEIFYAKGPCGSP
ncbi:MAG: RHS repeat-associated core domain-containing protein [Solirubrobacteraceae bacterium]